MKQLFWVTYGSVGRNLLTVLLLSLLLPGKAQWLSQANYDLSLSGTIGSGDYAPFWMHQGRWGTQLYLPDAMHLHGGVVREYRDTTRAWDLGFGVNAWARTARDTADILIEELYVKARFQFLELSVGSRAFRTGIEHEQLSNGGFLFSGNALPLPGITAGFDRFVTIPYSFGYLQVKGAMTHAWFTDQQGYKNEWLHHKYIHFLLGEPLPVRLHARLDHIAQWGGQSMRPGLPDHPSGLSAFFSVFMAQSGGADAISTDQTNVLGNHIISQSAKLEADLGEWQASAYWQMILEDNPLRLMGFTMNAPDGLWGMTLHHNNFDWVQTILYEYFNSTDQSGNYHDRDGIVYGGADNYFVGVYPRGWSHQGNTIGTPFIPSPVYAPGMPVDSLANRVRAHHIGVEGGHGAFRYRLLASYVNNYGKVGMPVHQVVKKSQQYYLLDMSYSLSRWPGFVVGLAVGLDRGEVTGNTTGLQFSLRKTGLLSK